jgi:thioredoxin reductase (NADPH)
MGQLALTTEVENFPGFPEGVQGPELMMNMKAQAEKHGATVITEDIVSIDVSRRPFVMKDTAGNTLEAKAVIIATGATANYLNLPSEGRFKNNGVSACAVCDGALPRYRKQPIVVVGGGDSACEEATYLTQFASQVHLIHRRDQLRASAAMAKRTLENPKIVPHWFNVVDEVLGTDEQGVTGVRIKDVRDGKTSVIDAVGMFVAIGHTPNVKFLNGQLKLDEKGYLLVTNPPRTQTSVKGVFAAGDVADSIYRQAITAAAMGCKAALDAQHFLSEEA